MAMDSEGHPFKTTHSVLVYLGRYTHRIAISNHRIIGYENGMVSFKYRGYSDGNKQKIMSLTVFEFMRRFLLHVLPPGYTKIRHYGILGSAVKSDKLSLCAKLLSFILTEKDELSIVELIEKLTGIDITICPVCGKALSRVSPVISQL